MGTTATKRPGNDDHDPNPTRPQEAPAIVEESVSGPATLTIVDPHGRLNIRLNGGGEPARVVCEIAEWWRSRRDSGDRPDIPVWLDTTPLRGTVTFPWDAERGAGWRYTLHLPASDAPHYPAEGPALRVEYRDQRGGWTMYRDLDGEWQLLVYTDAGPFGEPPADIITARAAVAHSTRPMLTGQRPRSLRHPACGRAAEGAPLGRIPVGR